MLSSIKHTASMEYLYVRVNDTGELDDFERIFSESFESNVKSSMDKAINGKQLTSDDWKNLISFVGAQIVRTPSFFQKVRPIIRDALERGLNESLKKMRTSKLKQETPPEINKYDELIPIQFVDCGNAEEGYSNIEVSVIEGKNTWLWAIQYLLSGHILDVLRKHKWSLITTVEEIPTSDDPVIILSRDETGAYYYDAPLAQIGTEIICPISPHKALYTEVGKKHNYYINFDVQKSQFLKTLIVNHAFREVYSMNKSDDITRIRPRTVDEEEFKNDKIIYDSWYDTYVKTEGEFLRKNQRFKKL